MTTLTDDQICAACEIYLEMAKMNVSKERRQRMILDVVHFLPRDKEETK